MRWRPHICAIGLLPALLAGSAEGQFPFFSAGMGTGLGGLYHEESLGGAPDSEAIGQFSAATWWTDLRWIYPSNLTLGLRAHLLRVGLEDPSGATLELLPMVGEIGFCREQLSGRLKLMAAAGVGVAWAHTSGGNLEPSSKTPLVATLSGAVDYGLTENLFAELGVASVLMDTEVVYERHRGAGLGTFAVDEEFRIQGRHLLMTLGVRWWFEWW